MPSHTSKRYAWKESPASPAAAKIQTNRNRHPHLAHYHEKELDGAQYGIRLKGGVTLPGPDYDEWD